MTKILKIQWEKSIFYSKAYADVLLRDQLESHKYIFSSTNDELQNRPLKQEQQRSDRKSVV